MSEVITFKEISAIIDTSLERVRKGVLLDADFPVIIKAETQNKPDTINRDDWEKYLSNIGGPEVLKKHFNKLYTDFINGKRSIHGDEPAKKTTIDDLAVEIDLIRKRMLKQEEITAAIDTRNYDEMKRRHKELSHKFQVMIDRVTICSEVAHFVRTSKLDLEKRAYLLDAAAMIYDVFDDAQITMLASKNVKDVIQWLIKNKQTVEQKSRSFAE